MPERMSSLTGTIPPEASGSLPGAGPASASAEREGEGWYLSPSLSAAQTQAGAYEVKLRIGCSQAEDILSWARRRLILDPHADPALGNAYRVRTVYFDTEYLDVYWKTPAYARCKYRLRRYGGEEKVFLECKGRREGQVGKQRTWIAADELGRLCESAPDGEWAGNWFRRQVRSLKLAPVCLIGYDRVAYVGQSENGPIRLTLDRDLCCSRTGYGFEEIGPRLPFLANEMVLELKFHAALPALFGRLVEGMGIRPGDVSKYRCGVEALGRGGRPGAFPLPQPCRSGR